jgi:predicted alpha/beta-fold hydrolase
LNHRGYCGVPLTTPQLYSPKSYTDVGECIDQMAERYPDRKIYLIGSSLGGGLAANYLGFAGDNCKVKAAVLSNAPMNFHSALGNIQTKYNGFLNKHMWVKMKQLHLEYFDILKESPPYKALNYETKLNDITTLTDYENQIGGPLLGYNSVEEYYTDLSPHKRVPGITVPTMIFNSLNDPICGENTLPIGDMVKTNPNILVGTTKTGSHNGHFEKMGHTK